ncbi:hypothetical protein LMG23994_06758 [Cupriavidus pinatubonensis]|uniref:ABC transmembrane type-1 domain-containing protein n=1 Tax=Cupriavidus pinatubonensis TaxID=248026 RepID=A0ABM8Y3T9_9BURK|nr:hypothetical protein LMG23994_06758 [Cupriavidus pinatubonensis]
MPGITPRVSRRRIAGELWRAIWRFRTRVLVAVALLLAKAAVVAVPLVLKLIVDEFTPIQSLAGAAPVGHAGSVTRPVVTMPAYLVLAYAVLRLLGNAFNELRDVVFASVAQNTVASFRCGPARS